MELIVVYVLCVIATFPLSEFPLHILEVVDEEDAVTLNPERLSEQRNLEPELDNHKTAEKPSDLGPQPQASNGSDDLPNSVAIAQRNKSFSIMLAITSIILLYMLWRVISFAWMMQLSKQELPVLHYFFWTLTAGSGIRLTYGLSASLRFYIYTLRPEWLPMGIPLRAQAWRACGICLALVIQGLGIVVAGVLVKRLVYDNLVKLAMVLGVRGN